MTQEGCKIPELTKGLVYEQLADGTDPKAIKRLTAAREYLKDSLLMRSNQSTAGIA